MVSSGTWICFAILFVKQLFGGLGQNFMNPALAARCFLLISFCRKNDGLYIRCSIRGNAACSHESRRERECFKPVSRKTAGTIGETSTLAILIGAVILLVFKVIDLGIPLSCLLSFSVLPFYLADMDLICIFWQHSCVRAD